MDWASGSVKLEPRHTKSGEGRLFPFAAMPRLKDLLEEQRSRTRAAERRSGRIIPLVFHRDGQPIRDFYHAWYAACDRAARGAGGAIIRPRLVGRVFHYLRRSAVRALVRAGVPEHTAMRLSGHKTRSVFARYDIVSDADLRDAVGKLAAYHEQRAVAS